VERVGLLDEEVAEGAVLLTEVGAAGAVVAALEAGESGGGAAVRLFVRVGVRNGCLTRPCDTL
jgi:hypothetical protein